MMLKTLMKQAEIQGHVVLSVWDEDGEEVERVYMRDFQPYQVRRDLLPMTVRYLFCAADYLTIELETKAKK